MAVSTLDKARTSLSSHSGPRETAGLRFTGSGPEYFRLWVVNTLLTLATLGVYSAWARAAKDGYFARNTQLSGASFNFAPDPKRILAGRVLVLLLLLGYLVAATQSPALGAVAIVLCAFAAPALALSAIRFRMRNTTWRGIAFNFTATHADAYRWLLPLSLAWAVGPVMAKVFQSADRPNEAWVYPMIIIPAVLLPWMHHRFKSFQYRFCSFGQLRISLKPATKEFYAAYAAAAILTVAPTIVLLNGFALAFRFSVGHEWEGSNVATAVLGLVAYSAAWPWLDLRLQSILAHNTLCGPLRFRARLPYRTYWKIVARTVPLLAVTGGLYWPLALIEWTRFKLTGFTVVCGSDVEQVFDGVRSDALDAGLHRLGADAFPMDIGW